MTASDRTLQSGSPWYRHFWPWFIVGLLGTSVAGSLVTVAIAYRYRDVDVRFAVDPQAPSGGVREVGAADARESGR